MQGIDISDGNDGLLTVTLRGILETIRPYVEGWHWSVLHLWAVGVLPGERTILDYESAASASPRFGARVSEEEMNLLAAHADQIIDAVFVANVDDRIVRKRSEDLDLYRENELVIEANDSTFWRVVSKKPEIIAALCRRFEDVSPVEFSPRESR